MTSEYSVRRSFPANPESLMNTEAAFSIVEGCYDFGCEIYPGVRVSSHNALVNENNSIISPGRYETHATSVRIWSHGETVDQTRTILRLIDDLPEPVARAILKERVAKQEMLLFTDFMSLDTDSHTRFLLDSKGVEAWKSSHLGRMIGGKLRTKTPPDYLLGAWELADDFDDPQDFRNMVFDLTHLLVENPARHLQ